MTAHERIVAELPSSATTLTIAAVEADRQFRVVHAGDSCVLVVGQRGKVKLRTIAHSPTGYAVEAGVLEPTDALSHEDRHLVSNLLGLGDVHIEVRPAIRLAPMDTVVLGTDGLFDNLHEEELVEIVRKGPLAKACARLGALVAERMAGVNDEHPSKPDDVTIILHRPGRP